MGWDVPWFVAGQDHGPEIARALAALAAGGREGITQPGDLKVTAQPIPDNTVSVAPGVLAALNRSPGANGQAYVARHNSADTVTLDPQGSIGVRYDLVAAVVVDPQYGGVITDGPMELRVYKDVPATTKYLWEVAPNISGLAVARVAFNASDGTINTSEITDLRSMVFARFGIEKRVVSLTGGNQVMASGSLDTYPPGAVFDVDIPTWANRVTLEASFSGIVAVDSGSDGGTAEGRVRVDLGPLTTSLGTFKQNAIGPGRATTFTAQAAQGDMDCSSIAGTTQTLEALAYTTDTAGMVIRSQVGTSVVITATFTEKAR